MIETIKLGNAENVMHVQLGQGMVMFTRVTLLEDNKFALVFNDNTEPKIIGDTDDTAAGKTTDELPNPVKLCISFTNPESINALIHSLVELQRDMFRGKLS